MIREPPRPYSNFDRAGVSHFIGTRGDLSGRILTVFGFEMTVGKDSFSSPE